MPAMMSSEAAKIIGVSAVSLHKWVRDELVPSERSGRKIMIEPEIVKEVKYLREKFGTKWHKHAAWIPGADTTAEPTVKKEKKEVKHIEFNIYERLLMKAREASRAGAFKQACEYYEVLMGSLDLSEM